MRGLFSPLISVRAALLFEWSLVITKKTCRPLFWVGLTKAGTWTTNESCTAEAAGSCSLDFGSDTIRTGACSSGSVSSSTYKLFEGRGVWLRFVELSDRSTSLAYRVPVTALNQRIMSLYLPPSPSNLRDKQLSEKIWKWARWVPDETPSGTLPCFCWMPTVTSPKLHGQTRSERTAAKKTHSTASAWENFCEITLAGGELILSSGGDFLWTFHQYSVRLCVSSGYRSCSQMLCTAPRRRQIETGSSSGKKGSSPHSVCLSTSSYIRNARKKSKITNGTRTSLRRVPFSRRTGKIWRSPIVGETQSSARGRWR